MIQSTRRDPTAIFDNRGAASAPPTAQQAVVPRAHTEVVSPAGDLVTDDPMAPVTAVVRPNHNYGGVPAGMEITIPFGEFEAHQAALCSRAEYARISAQQASPENHALQRQIADMRAATSDAFYRGLPDDKRRDLEAARARAREDDNQTDAARRDIARAAAQHQPAPAAARSAPVTPQGLDARIAALREQYAAAARLVGEHGAAALRTAEEQEIAALREMAARAYRAEEMAALRKEYDEMKAPVFAPHNAVLPQGSGVQRLSVGERLKSLRALLGDGLITDAQYDARAAQILGEV